MPRKKPNKDYWIKRQEDLQNSLLKPAEDYTAEIAKGCREAIREIEKQIAVWYQRFADNNDISLAEANRILNAGELKELKWDVWEYIKHGEQNAIDQRWMRELENASARVHISRLEALKLQIRQQAEKLYGDRADKVKELIGDVYRESLYKNGYEDFLRTGAEHIFDRIDQKKLNKIIDKPWTVDGKNFSERIWGNKQKLINELNNELTRGIAMGENPNKTAKVLAQKLNSDFNAARRLVMTESAYFATQGQKECYRELDVEEYEILGTLDSTTCERCGSYDGKHFPTKDMQVGVNAPPFHPNCRCTTIPYFDDEFTQNEKRAATDENGNYIEVGNMNYEEWKNKYVVKNNVANGNENGIIKSGDNVNTKLSERYEVLNPMDSNTYLKMKTALEKQGYTVISATSEDDINYLKLFGAEAISDEFGILHLGETPSASAFFEEVIHLTQMKKYGIPNSTDFVDRTAREVAANRMLLKNAKAYNFAEEDIAEIKSNLKKWEDDFIRKVGISYEESGIDRGI